MMDFFEIRYSFQIINVQFLFFFRIELNPDSADQITGRIVNIKTEKNEEWHIKNSLDLSYLGLSELPESFGYLIVDGDLFLEYNQLTSLPESFGNLTVKGHFRLSENQLISLPESFGSLTVGGNLTVNGTTTTVNSTTTTLDDPIMTLGGDTAPGSDDNKDRGLEFRYYSGSAKVGFMGWDDSEGKFTLMTDATNSSEVFSGTLAALKMGALTASSVTGATIDGGTY